MADIPFKSIKSGQLYKIEDVHFPLLTSFDKAALDRGIKCVVCLEFCMGLSQFALLGCCNAPLHPHCAKSWTDVTSKCSCCRKEMAWIFEAEYSRFTEGKIKILSKKKIVPRVQRVSGDEDVYEQEPEEDSPSESSENSSDRDFIVSSSEENEDSSDDSSDDSSEDDNEEMDLDAKRHERNDARRDDRTKCRDAAKHLSNVLSSPSLLTTRELDLCKLLVDVIVESVPKRSA